MSKILFIAASLGYGGAAKMLTFVAQELQKRGHNVSIVNINSVSGCDDAYERDVSSGVNIYKVSTRGRKGLKRLGQIREIKKIAKDISADIIIGFTSFPNIYATIVGKSLGIPSIMSERGDPSQTIGKTLKDKIFTFIINRSKGGVFQTDGAKTYYGKGLQKRGAVIANPIFVNGEIPKVEPQDREKTVVSVGRLENLQKRYDVMLKAFKLFSDRHPEYKLKLYGDGPAEKDIKKWIEELDLQDKVLLMGLTKTPMQDIAKDGMFIITSDFEGISNSLLEAMAIGIPCVSTDHTPGGARMLIQHGENGLLAPMGNAEKLAECMCTFAENKDLAKSCGAKAKEVLQRFAPEVIINQWERYILELCKKGKKNDKRAK